MVSQGVYKKSLLENARQQAEINRLMEYTKKLEDSILCMEDEASEAAMASTRQSATVQSLRDRIAELLSSANDKDREKEALELKCEKLAAALDQSRLQ